MKSDLVWDRIKAFAQVAEYGSLSAAARQTETTQPTLSRQIVALERAAGVQLFDRTAKGLVLTPVGTELLAHARVMVDASNKFSLLASGRSESIGGTVRITASEIVAAFILPDILSDLRIQQPGISIELVASNQSSNLLIREADIAVRMYKPVQSDLIARKLGELEVGIYTTDAYIKRKGSPKVLNEIIEHDVVGYDVDDQIIRGFLNYGIRIDRKFFAFRSDNQLVAWELVRAGLGIGFMPVKIADADSLAKRLLPDQKLPVLPVWLTAHSELRTSARIRYVYDYLVKRLEKKLSRTSSGKPV